MKKLISLLIFTIVFVSFAFSQYEGDVNNLDKIVRVDSAGYADTCGYTISGGGSGDSSWVETETERAKIDTIASLNDGKVTIKDDVVCDSTLRTVDDLIKMNGTGDSLRIYTALGTMFINSTSDLQINTSNDAIGLNSGTGAIQFLSSEPIDIQNDLSVGDTAFFGSGTTTKIYRAGTNDLTFDDPNTGIKTLSELSFVPDSTWGSIEVIDSSILKGMFILDGGINSSKIYSKNPASGNQIEFVPYSGSFNTVTLKLGSAGGFTDFETSGAAWKYRQDIRFDNAGVASIYCNNSSNGLGLNGRNSRLGDIFIESNGNVGIGNGTNTPDADLHIKSDSSSSAFDVLFIENSSSDEMFRVTSIGNAYVGEFLGFVDDENTGVGTNGTGVLDFKANNVTGMDIDDGNDDVTVYKTDLIANNFQSDTIQSTGTKIVFDADTTNMFDEDITGFVDVDAGLDLDGRLTATRVLTDSIYHAVGGFQDSSVSVGGTQNTWYQVTNATGNLFGGTEVDGFSLSADTMVMDFIGDAWGIAVLSFEGGNGNSYEFRLWNQTDGVQEGFHQRVTASGAGNGIQITLPVYLEASEVGEKFTLDFQNIDANNNATFISAEFILMYAHE